MTPMRRWLLLVTLVLFAAVSIWSVSALETPAPSSPTIDSVSASLLFNCYGTSMVEAYLPYGSPVEDTIALDCAAPGAVITSIEVQVSVDHDCSSDLNIRLNGFNAAGHWAEDFLQERNCDTPGGDMMLNLTSQAFNGATPDQTWHLTLVDWCDNECEGTWNSWSIRAHWVVPTATPTLTDAPSQTPEPSVTVTQMPSATTTETPWPQASLTETPAPVATQTATSRPSVTHTPTSAPSLSVCPDQDTYVAQGNPDSNYGLAPDLYAGWGQGPGEDFARRILIQYDLRFIPPDATISSATLEMAMTEASGVGVVLLGIYRLIDPWDALATTWNAQPNYDGTQRAQASAPLAYPGTVSWDVTDLVRDWVMDPEQNYGLLIRSSETGSHWMRKFDSGDQQTSFCPRLIINATAPGPIPTLTDTPTPSPTPTGTAICPYPDEDGDSQATAATIVPSTGSEATGYICPSEDKDYWAFPASLNQQIIIGLGNPPGNPPGVPAPNYDMCLLRPDGSVADCSTNLIPSYGEYLNTKADATGTWAILVQGKGPADWNKTQPYDLYVNVCNKPDEAANYWSGATLVKPSISEMSIDNSFDAYLCPSGDHDYWKFAVPANTTVTITAKLTNLPDNYDLHLYDPSGSLVTGSVNSGTTNETISHTTSQQGEWSIGVTTYLSQFNATQPYHLDIDVQGLVRDFSADALEVTQGIQNLANDVDLVATKTTYVRVYGRLLKGQTAGNVECVLHGTQGGSALPGSPLKPVNGTQSLSSTLYDRGNAADGWLYKLPASWISEGHLTLRPSIDNRMLYYDDNRANNERTETVYFDTRSPVCGVFVPVRTKEGPTSTNDKNFWDAVSLMKRLWPVPNMYVFHMNDNDVAELEVCWWGPVPYPCYGPYELFSDNWKVLLALNTRANLTDDPDICDDAGGRSHYIGMVHANTPTDDVAGCGYVGWHEAWFKMPSTSSTAPATGSSTQPWEWPREGNTLAHEMGHNKGFKHVDCGDPDDTEYYPYAVCQLDDMGSDMHYGFDTKSLMPIDPLTTRDLMAYGSPRWISDYNWERLYSRVGSGSDEVRPAMAIAGPNLSTAEASVMVCGAISTTETGGTLDYAWMYDTVAQSTGILGKWQQLAVPSVDEITLKDEGNYHVRVYGPGNDILTDRPVTPAQALQVGELDDINAFTLTFPAPSGAVESIELLMDETVLDTLAMGSSIPTVGLLAPVAGTEITDTMTIIWEGDDPDPADALRYTLQYSPDAGETWRILASGIPEPPDGAMITMTLNDLSSLPGSPAGTPPSALVRVAASDGYNTRLATSDVFTLSDRPPAPTILSPVEDVTYGPQDTVHLEGMVSDAEDGGLLGESLQWFLNGLEVGQGQEVLLSDLQPGEYDVELFASDSQMNVGHDWAPLTIGPLELPDAPAPVIDGYADDDSWDAAISLSLHPYEDGSTATAKLMRTGSTVSIGFTGLRPSSEPGEVVAGILLDANGSGDEGIDAGDLALLINELGQTSLWTANGAGDWQGEPDLPEWFEAVSARTASGWSATLCVDTSRIPDMCSTPNLALAHLGPGEDAALWPHSAGGAAPVSWAAVVGLTGGQESVLLPLIRK